MTLEAVSNGTKAVSKDDKSEGEDTMNEVYDCIVVRPNYSSTFMTWLFVGKTEDPETFEKLKMALIAVQEQDATLNVALKELSEKDIAELSEFDGW